MLDPAPLDNQVTIKSCEVEVMGLMGSNGMVFPYLGFLICCTVDCELEIKQWASSTCECTMALGQNIWHSCISLNTKLHLYSSCILPIFLYGMETYMWLYRPQRHLTFLIIGVYAEFWMLDCIASNDREVQSRTHKPPLSDTVHARRLRLFRHVYRADSIQDHLWALLFCVSSLPKNWKRRHGRPRQTWLWTVEGDLGLVSAYQHAQNRTAWDEIMDMDTSMTSPRWWRIVLMLLISFTHLRLRAPWTNNTLLNDNSRGNNWMAPFGLWGCKNRPAPFPGQMYKATKPGLVCVLYLSML